MRKVEASLSKKDTNEIVKMTNLCDQNQMEC